MEFYTANDLAAHADLDSCWYGLYGVVYDLTCYIDEHKGGVGVILVDCGKDSTANFVAEKKHDVDMLIKKGFIPSIIGRLGSQRGTQSVPCDEVELPAVTGF
jgi:cytochrome b involved in lipid metabolism